MDNGLNNSDKLIISVFDARKILGKSYESYSDEYIEQLIRKFDNIATSFIKTVPNNYL